MYIAEKVSCKAVLTKGAKKMASSVEAKGLIANAIPRITVSNAHNNPDKAPLIIVIYPHVFGIC